MAVQNMRQSVSIGIKVQSGFNAAGVAQFKTLHFSGVKTDAVDQDVFDVATALGNVQSLPVSNILRVDTGDLVNV